MDIELTPRPLKGVLDLPPSKSVAQRLIFLSALSETPQSLRLSEISEDIEASLRAALALGANVIREGEKITLIPRNPPDEAKIHCGESAATLRMTMMIAPGRVEKALFVGEKSLARRSVKSGIDALERAGIAVEGDHLPLEIRGRYPSEKKALLMDGKATSQFISGALIAAATGKAPRKIDVVNITSAPYIAMTLALLERAGIAVEKTETGFLVAPGRIDFGKSPLDVEGDRSHAAFFLAANELGARVEIPELKKESVQGDAVFLDLVRAVKRGRTVDLSDTPDLLIPLALVATRFGGDFRGIERLKDKESDRVRSTARMLRALGIEVEVYADRLRVEKGAIRGGIVESEGDHRIAFAAAVASSASRDKILIRGAEATEKSWRNFWKTLRILRGEA